MKTSTVLRVERWSGLFGMLRFCALGVLLSCALGSVLGIPSAAALTAEGIPSRTVPLQFGVNIHFVEPREKDIQMIADAGFRFIRMDFTWSRVEREKGKYNFSGYERLVSSLASREIRPLFILDYGNSLYEDGLAPRSEEGRGAFCKFAAAAARRFAGKGILWEIWNEPNLNQFWKPAAKAEDYCALAVAVCRALRDADPKCTIVAPATSQIDLKFIEKVFQAGILQWLDGVTVHPYRMNQPESVTPEYQRLRELIDKYAPPEKKGLPILSGEWGYSLWHYGGVPFSPEKQASYIARQFLVNLMNDVRLSIWYDWHDDGPDPKETEHNFGIVTYTYELKPSYLSAKTLLHTLKGMSFVRRIKLESPDDYALLFSDGKSETIAVWTAGEIRGVSLPVKGKRVRIISMTGEHRNVEAPEGRLDMEIAQNPQYVVTADFPAKIGNRRVR